MATSPLQNSMLPKPFSVIKHGIPLDPGKYTWDEKTRTFRSDEANLVLDFSQIEYVNFYTKSSCVFITLNNCNFNTGAGCSFRTGSYCKFNTGLRSTFDTGSDCDFDVTNDCSITTFYNSKIKVEGISAVHRVDTKEAWMIKNRTIYTKDHQEPGYYTEEEFICKDIIR